MSEEGPGFFLPFPLPIDPEMLEKMRQAKDHEAMVVEDYHHGIARFLDSLNEEQLTAQKSLLHVVAANSKGSSRVIPAYYEGILIGILSAKYGICIGCENNHEKLMAEQLQRESEQQDQPPVPMDGGDPFKPGQKTVDLHIGEGGMLSDEQLANMEQYNLDDLRDEDTGRLMGFVCLGCGMQYPSIEDRMLKPADKGGCSGCVQKEQWG
jgi:hypothetical protein